MPGLLTGFQNSFSYSQERIKAWQAWQSATAALTKKREAKVKAELQQKVERINSLRQEIADHERMQVRMLVSLNLWKRVARELTEVKVASLGRVWNRFLLLRTGRMQQSENYL